jgi:hypothetical protein
MYEIKHVRVLKLFVMVMYAETKLHKLLTSAADED